MADATVRLVDDSTNTGKKVDTSEITVGSNTVERQRVNLADPTSATAIQAVKDASTPAALTDPAAVVALSPNSPLTKAKFRNLKDTQQSIKAAAGVLFGLQVLNGSGADCFVQVFNAAVDVVLGTEDPLLEFRVAAGGSLYPPLPALGVPFATGIRVASTTGEKGAVGSADGVMLFAQYA